MSISYKLAARLNPLANGQYTQSDEFGNVISVQPDGSVETRPAGADGQYERLDLVGVGFVYHPRGDVDPSSPKYLFLPSDR